MSGLTIVALVLFVFLIVGGSAIYLDAKLGGWRSLARRYPDQGTQVGGESWKLEPVKLGGGSAEYRVLVTANPTGMKLSLDAGIVRFVYPDLFLPWRDVAAQREQHWYGDRVHLRFAAVPDVPLTIRGKLADEILNRIGLVWIEAGPPPGQSPAAASKQSPAGAKA